MGMFRSMMSVNFRVDEKGETTFFFPVLGGAWCPRKGYRIASDEDVAKLKRYLGFFYGVLIFGIAIPFLAVSARLRETMDISFSALLLFLLAIVFAYAFIFERVAIRGIVEKYGRTEERLRFRELQRMQGASYSRAMLFVAGFFSLLFLAFGLFGVISGFAVGPGIGLVVIFSLLGAQVAYQVKLSRQGDDGTD